MKNSFSQERFRSHDGRQHIRHDWYAAGIPGNTVLHPTAYLDSSYGFSAFHSEQQPGLTLGTECGYYNRGAFITGRAGRIDVGNYTVLNGTTLICYERISIGSHCLLSWGSIVADGWLDPSATPPDVRRRLLETIAHDPRRCLLSGSEPRPVVLEDNVWVGFGAIILPGVRLGEGCVVASKAIVNQNVEPYTVVAGDPLRIIRRLEPESRK